MARNVRGRGRRRMLVPPVQRQPWWRRGVLREDRSSLDVRRLLRRGVADLMERLLPQLNSVIGDTAQAIWRQPVQPCDGGRSDGALVFPYGARLVEMDLSFARVAWLVVHRFVTQEVDVIR